MSSVTLNVVIDKDKCVECKRCAANCLLVQYLGFPSIEEAPEECCNLCGHCIAACENDAISNPKLNKGELIPAGEIPTAEQMLNLIRVRRSFRTFKDQPVKKEDLEKLIEAVRYSMTGRNAQEVNIVLIQSEDKINNVANAVMDFTEFLAALIDYPEQCAEMEKQFGKDSVDYLKTIFKYRDVQKEARTKGHNYATYNASVLMLLTGPTTEHTSQADSVLAAQAVALLAPTLGLSACYNAVLTAAYAANFPPLMEALKGIVAENEVVFAALMLGYEKFRYPYFPPRKERKVTYI